MIATMLELLAPTPEPAPLPDPEEWPEEARQ